MATTRKKKPDRVLDSSFDEVAVRAARRALTEFVVSDELRALVTQVVNEVVPLVMKNAVVPVIAEVVPPVLSKYGIDVADAEAQRKDMMHLRNWREIMEMIRMQGIRTFIGYVLAALVATIIMGTGIMLYRVMPH